MPYKPNIQTLIELQVGSHLSAMRATIIKAYENASAMGKDGGIWRYAPPLERERIADEQGRMAQDAMLKWAETQPTLKTAWETNSRGLPHLAIFAGALHITIHRVLTPRSFPKNAKYRQQNALSNRCWLPGLEPDYDVQSGVYLYILHGPSPSEEYKVGFIQLAVPEPDQKGWLYIQNLSEGHVELAAVEDTSAKPRASLKSIKKFGDEN